MCYILNNFHNKPFDKQELNLAYQGNKHGTGLIWTSKSDNRLHTCKFEMGTPFETIWDKVQQINSDKDIVNVGIHFRFATSGLIGLRTTHPIAVLPNKIYLMHNGCCSHFLWDPRYISDTQCMAYWLKNLFLANNIKDLKSLKKHRQLLSYLSKVFSNNKVVLFDTKGSLVINPQLGSWKDGIWRSRPLESNPYITK